MMILAPDLGNSSEVLDMPWQLDALEALIQISYVFFCRPAIPSASSFLNDRCWKISSLDRRRKTDSNWAHTTLSLNSSLLIVEVINKANHFENRVYVSKKSGVMFRLVASRPMASCSMISI